MRAIELTAPRLDAFQPVVRPDPTPADGRVLVRLRAATPNYLDVAVATGRLFGPRLPRIPVADLRDAVRAAYEHLAAGRHRGKIAALPD